MKRAPKKFRHQMGFFQALIEMEPSKKMILFGMILLSLLISTTSCIADETIKPSPGCGRQAPGAPPASIQVDGHTREFISVVPDSYDASLAHRLIFAFHGRTASNTRVRKYYRLEQNSKKPTIFVYPAGLVAADGKYSWYTSKDPRNQLRDFEFFDALLEQLSSNYCIDLDQIFAVGHSLGASFANSLGCARGSLIRGVGTVAGRIWEIKCSGPAATMLMHNPKDDLVPVSRGLNARDWALDQNGLQPPPRACESRSLNCERYGPPDAQNPVVWCPHTEDHNRRGKFYPHLWPQEAGAAIMDFFDSLPASAR
jgi:polyhydroxybutyrate depolymerase